MLISVAVSNDGFNDVKIANALPDFEGTFRDQRCKTTSDEKF